MDEPKESGKRLTAGKLLSALALDQRAFAASKLDIAGLTAYPGLSAIKLDLANFEGAKTRVTLGDALSSYWRGQLADATPRIQGSIAGQMSQVMAGLRLPMVGLAGIDAEFLNRGLSASLAGSIADAVGSSFADSLRRHCQELRRWSGRFHPPAGSVGRARLFGGLADQ